MKQCTEEQNITNDVIGVCEGILSSFRLMSFNRSSRSPVHAKPVNSPLAVPPVPHELGLNVLYLMTQSVRLLFFKLFMDRLSRSLSHL
jgi:hypothetical protein